MKKKLVQMLYVTFLFIYTSTAAYTQHKKPHSLNKQLNKQTLKQSSEHHNRTRAHLVVDVDTGKILFEDQPHKPLHPASLTKMMTIYMIFDAVRKHKISFDDYAIASPKASNMPPSKLWLKPGDEIKYRDIVSALIVKSCNDAAVTAAENLAGSEEEFARRMNRQAKKLGMHRSNFANASGLHHPSQKSTAADLAKLGIALKKDFPEFYHMFAQTEFTFNGSVYKGHNRVTEQYAGAPRVVAGAPRSRNAESPATGAGD